MLLRIAARLFLVAATPAAAQTPVLTALRQQNWAAAARLAAAEPDALAPKLVTFIRLLNPDQANASEIGTFMAANPGWPDRPVLEKRYAEALTAEPDARVAAGQCLVHAPQSAPALLRCADAYALQADPAGAAQAARRAWVTGLAAPDEEAAFLSRWASATTAADQRARFDHLETVDQAAAARQLARLDATTRPLAAARLALRQGTPDALAALTSVPAAERADPAVLLAEARFLRRSHADQAALSLWRTAMPAAEAASPPAQRAAFWVERDTLARRLLTAGDAESAFWLADDTSLPVDQAVDADFLAGWVALRRLHDPAKARLCFGALAAVSRSAITQARAAYWLGRAAPDETAARAAYARAALWPLTYYGQLAARAAGVSEAALRASIASQRDPSPNVAEARGFESSEFARAARILVRWQDPRRAADFLLQAAQPPAGLMTRSLVAGLATRLGLSDVAVQAARLIGRDGGVLPQDGWPVPVQPPSGAVAAPLTLGLMRQESSFDPLVVSGAGARGLMQLMPGTAQQMGRALHAPSGPLTDPEINMRLGTAYLANLLARFHDTVPFAIAAYNAGPRRVDDWIAANGDPSTDVEAMVDWIELIPFAETRNYVQRVLENETVYASRAGS
jgi:soluble lytic murein transglycosylase